MATFRQQSDDRRGLDRSGDLPAKYLWWLVFPLAIALSGLWIFQLIAVDMPTADAAIRPVPDGHSLSSIGAFYRWLGVSLLGAFVYAGAAAYCAAQLVTTTKGRALTSLLLCGLAALAIVGLAVAGGLKLKFMRLGLNAIAFADDVAGTSTNPQNATPDMTSLVDLVAALNPMGAAAYGLFLTVVNFLVFAAAILVALGTVSTLSRRPQGCALDAVAWQAHKLMRLKHFLYAGAAVFVFGEFAINAWLAMGGSLLPADVAGLQDSYSDLAIGISSYFGALYVLILAAAYGPASVILARQSRALAFSELAEKSVEPDAPSPGHPAAIRRWLVAKELELAWQEQVKMFIATFSPLLAGPVTATISGLSG